MVKAKPHSLIGQSAPAISLPNFDGSTFTFTPGESGRPTALFFYPQSGTYGCTKEACQFRDALAEEEIFKSTKVEVIGISPDSVEKQKQFVEKQGLTYAILSDEKGDARQAYNVSRGLMGLTASDRVTFVIDSEGIIKDVYDSVLNFSAHHKFVQDWLKNIEPKQPSATKAADTPASTTVADAPSPTPAANVPAPAPASEEHAPTTVADAPAPTPVAEIPAEKLAATEEPSGSA